MEPLTALIIGLAMLIGYWCGTYHKRNRRKTPTHWDGDMLVLSDTGEIVADIEELERGTWAASFHSELFDYVRTGPQFIDRESAKKFAEQNYRMP